MKCVSKVRGNPNPSPGDQLRDEAADMLAATYGRVFEEKRAGGKKVDLYFEIEAHNKTTRMYVEGKDEAGPLHRSRVNNIWADYEGILRKNAPAQLLLITRRGLATGALSYVQDEKPEMLHQTIWELETGLINLRWYLDQIEREFRRSGLPEYFIESGFRITTPLDSSQLEMVQRTHALFDETQSLISQLLRWSSDNSDKAPVAVLGGYGTGKTSLAVKLAAELGRLSMHDRNARQPILIKLGGISRYSGIDGILGSHFTNEYSIPTFNWRHFCRLNEKGRYLIILDGFDEMKHAMTWHQFKAQVRELLDLLQGDAKVLLLGRPSAFLSEDEHRYILKGQRPTAEGYRGLPGWPMFHELELEDFSRDQRAKFVRAYLEHNAGILGNIDAAKRAGTANQIADENEELFGRPVHSRILTDLAVNASFDLTKFRGEASRWKLYHEFLGSIMDREMEKRERVDISAERRMRFQRKLAYWLWTSKDTQISFSAREIPKSLLEDFKPETDEVFEALTRELLTGSILQRKTGDVFFFEHRSFAEFLVADHMLSSVPVRKAHSQFSHAFQDGVKDFIVESGNQDRVEDWISSFSSAEGPLQISYIDFLSEQVGGIEALCNRLSEGSNWQDVLSPFSESLQFTATNHDSVMTSLRTASPTAFAWRLLWLLDQPATEYEAIKRPSPFQGNFVKRIVQYLVSLLFTQVEQREDTFFIPQEASGLRDICRDSIGVFNDRRGDYFQVDLAKLRRGCQKIVEDASISLGESTIEIQSRTTIDNSEMTASMDRFQKGKLGKFLDNGGAWQQITVLVDKTDVQKRNERRQAQIRRRKNMGPLEKDRYS